MRVAKNTKHYQKHASSVFKHTHAHPSKKGALLSEFRLNFHLNFRLVPPLTATSTSRAPHLAKDSPKFSQCDWMTSSTEGNTQTRTRTNAGIKDKKKEKEKKKNHYDKNRFVLDRKIGARGVPCEVGGVWHVCGVGQHERASVSFAGQIINAS